MSCRMNGEWYRFVSSARFGFKTWLGLVQLNIPGFEGDLALAAHNAVLVGTKFQAFEQLAAARFLDFMDAQQAEAAYEEILGVDVRRLPLFVSRTQKAIDERGLSVDLVSLALERRPDRAAVPLVPHTCNVVSVDPIVDLVDGTHVRASRGPAKGKRARSRVSSPLLLAACQLRQ